MFWNKKEKDRPVIQRVTLSIGDTVPLNLYKELQHKFGAVCGVSDKKGDLITLLESFLADHKPSTTVVCPNCNVLNVIPFKTVVYKCGCCATMLEVQTRQYDVSFSPPVECVEGKIIPASILKEGN